MARIDPETTRADSLPPDEIAVFDLNTMFSNRITAGICALLLVSHAALLAWSATTHSPTVDEPGHLAAGLVQWEFGRFELYRVNPPLVHYVAALPVIAAGYNADWSDFEDRPGSRPEFAMGSAFIRANR